MAEPNATNDVGEPPPQLAGLLAQFDGPDGLKAAAAKVRQAGWTRWDIHSPFPVHGIERAMGLRPTLLPWLVLGAGLSGAAAAAAMQLWTNGIDYPFIVSGKPPFSLPSGVPILFELTVLLAALAAFGGALVLGRLPQYWHPTFGSRRFRRVTTDGFFIWLDASDPRFDAAAARALLESAGAGSVEDIYDSPAGRRLPASFSWAAAVAIVLGLLPLVAITWYRAGPKSQPRLHPIQDMDFQEKYQPQAASPLFADGRAMRPPLPGTIAEGTLDADDHFYRGQVGGQWAATFPMPVTMPLMQRGQERYNIFCATCHGLVGEGGSTGPTGTRADKRGESAWVPPLSLHVSSVRQQPAGQIFHSISNGVRKMPAYGPQIPVADRWAIVLYVRALQRSQDATLHDVPAEYRDRLR